MEMATLSLIGSAVSGVVGAAGSIMQGQAAADSARYNAAVARNNQIIAGQQAARAAQAGRTQAQNRDFTNAQRMGAITAAEGASGIDLGSGSSREVRDAASRLGRLDTSTVLSNAENVAAGYTAQGANFGAQAALDTAQASNASTAGLLGGFGSLIGGASQFADKWVRFQNTGLTTNTGGL